MVRIVASPSNEYRSDLGTVYEMRETRREEGEGGREGERDRQTQRERDRERQRI